MHIKKVIMQVIAKGGSMRIIIFELGFWIALGLGFRVFYKLIRGKI
jgi:hypothetical protein